jgi:transaldolase
VSADHAELAFARHPSGGDVKQPARRLHRVATVFVLTTAVFPTKQTPLAWRCGQIQGNHINHNRHRDRDHAYPELPVHMRALPVGLLLLMRRVRAGVGVMVVVFAVFVVGHAASYALVDWAICLLELKIVPRTHRLSDNIQLCGADCIYNWIPMRARMSALHRPSLGAFMANLLDQLKSVTTVVADSGDINSIKKYKPTDSTTNPSLIEAAAQMPEYQSIVDDVLQTAREKAGENASDEDVAAAAFKTLAVAFGRKILDIVPGRVSTEVDARLSYDSEKTMEQAHDIIQQYEDAGISRERILIKIASTWEGIKAAEKLEQEGIHCNLTLLFGLHQAVACAEAKVTLISPFVGRILDWYKADTGQEYRGPNDPGVKSVTEIYHYYKKFGYKTVVMGASFRNTSEIIERAGCDLLTIAPKYLEELQTTQGMLIRKLDPTTSKNDPIKRITMDQATFEKMHAENRMAHDKLKEGIEGFSKALEDLEQLLTKRLSELPKPQTVQQ